VAKALNMMPARFPEYLQPPDAEAGRNPNFSGDALDYTKGFGHTDLVVV
jgi:hypothetical protein